MPNLAVTGAGPLWLDLRADRWYPARHYEDASAGAEGSNLQSAFSSPQAPTK